MYQNIAVAGMIKSPRSMLAPKLLGSYDAAPFRWLLAAFAIAKFE